MQHYEVVDVDYKKMENMAVNALDHDGDGILTMKDAHIARDRVQKQLSVGMPSVASFCMGFAVGMFYG